jgi:hypothetical protein
MTLTLKDWIMLRKTPNSLASSQTESTMDGEEMLCLLPHINLNSILMDDILWLISSRNVDMSSSIPTMWYLCLTRVPTRLALPTTLLWIVKGVKILKLLLNLKSLIKKKSRELAVLAVLIPKAF